MKTKLSIFLVIFTFLFLSCQKKSETYFESMNTFMKVQCYGENSEKANAEAQKLIGELNTLISVTKAESEIYKLNHAQEYPVEVSTLTADLLKTTLNMSRKTDGALNPCLYPLTSAWGFTTKKYRVPSQEEIDNLLANCKYQDVQIDKNKITAKKGMMFDLGAVGKGFAGDQAIQVLKSHGIKSAILDLGGNIQTIGSRPDGSKWVIGIKSPFTLNSIGTVKVSNKAVITSAGYERFFQTEDGEKHIHIFDGSTGRPVKNEVLSATAIGKSGLYCDALSTSLFVMGVERSIQLWKEEKDFDFIIITKDKKLYITKDISKDFTLNKDDANIQVIIVK